MGDKVQISCSYQMDEDRVLMRARVGGKDARMWMTRRMTLHFLASIGRVFDHLGGVQAQPQEQRQAVNEFRRDAALGQADFQTPYAEENLEPFPLEGGPMLVTKLNVAALKKGGVQLTLTGTQPEGIRLNLGEKELHAVVHMLTQLVAKAEWGAIPSLTQKAPAAKKAPAKPRLVN